MQEQSFDIQRPAGGAGRIAKTEFIPELNMDLDVFDGELSPVHQGSVQMRQELNLWIHPGIRYLDMGTGTGVHAFMAGKVGAKVTAVDLETGCAEHNRDALGMNIDIRQGDLFQPIQAGETFDVISFFPPQSPYAMHRRLARDEVGFDPGYRTLIKFLAEAADYLAPDGVILILHSIADRNDIRKWASAGGLKLVHWKKAGHEYCCYRLKRCDRRQRIRGKSTITDVQVPPYDLD